jgi:hypothetical protein
MMAEKFNPAPHDKYAEDPKQKQKTDQEERLNDGLKETFPASDPPSHTQPPKTKAPDRKE